MAIETLKVLVAESLAEEGVEMLRGVATVDVKLDLSPQNLLDVIGGYDAVIVRSATKIDAEVIDNAPRLKVIGRAGTGFDNIDVDAATRKGILVVNAPESNTLAAAEHTMALLLAMARNIPVANASLKAGRWERSLFVGVELHGKTLGVLGLGRIGTLVAQRAAAFGMRLLAYDPYVSRNRAAQLGIELVETVDQICQQSDFISVHLPKTSETKAMLGAQQFSLMRPGVRIVNVARGGLIDEVALADALQTGKVAGAALDVFDQEPPDPGPMFDNEAVVVTPHLGA
ncbi:MAG: hydroxyacid dehydrogenase, partial [Actinomycetota bacterium]